MNNPFRFEQEPCLDFLHSDSPQSNSLLGPFIVKQQVCEYQNYSEQYMQNEENPQGQHLVKTQGRQRWSRPKTKQKKKVFYRDKMAELLNEENYIKPQYNYIDFAQYEKDKSPISRQQQLKRNRESAKQSRQRKKEYVETLQQKNKLNQKQIGQLTQRLRQTQLQRDRLRQSNNTEMQSFNQLKSKCYDKLSALLQVKDAKEDKKRDIEACIVQLRQRFGSDGKERANLLNYLMSQIIQNLMTDFQKYFINCAISNTGIFAAKTQNNPISISKLDLEIGSILGLNQQKQIPLNKIYKQRFQREAILFHNICQQLYQSFSMLTNQSYIVQNIFDDMRKQFEAEEIAKLILYFQENKFRKDLRKVRNEWYENFKRNDDEIVDSMRKLTKRYQS